MIVVIYRYIYVYLFYLSGLFYFYIININNYFHINKIECHSEEIFFSCHYNKV